ncbi:MAG: alpha/beta hydrolase [Solirubrobacterales bacterium]|nr:alpha/beta hydrolase [Solirubrobacterales bacterium]MBV8942741.1 alpha/beta hydrolase [Solirubrobacterales bacterium]
MISYDRRGYVRSGGEPVRSIATHTADAAALLDALQTPPVVAVGTSIGATIAIDLTLRRPDLVRAVLAHESPWRVTRQPPTVSQIAALRAWAGWRREAGTPTRRLGSSALPIPTVTAAAPGTRSPKSGGKPSARMRGSSR